MNIPNKGDKVIFIGANAKSYPYWESVAEYVNNTLVPGQEYTVAKVSWSPPGYFVGHFLELEETGRLSEFNLHYFKLANEN